MKRYHNTPPAATATPENFAKPFTSLLHVLFTEWKSAGGLHRDFPEVINHVASLLLLEDLMNPGILHEAALLPAPPELPALAPYRAPGELPVKRFYDDEGEITSFSTDTWMLLLGAYFTHWCAAGFHPRDFLTCAHEYASSEVYDYELCRSFEGLGGGKTEKEFLTTSANPGPQ